MRNLLTHATHAASRRALTVAAALATLGAASACDTNKLLEVKNPGIAEPGTLTGESGLAAYYAAAVGDFAVGFSGDPNGDYEGLVNYGGLLADEIGSVDTYPTRNETDQRRTQFNNASSRDVFRAIQRARASAELASTQFATSGIAGAAQDPRRSEVLSLAGFSYVIIAEDYCSGVPFGAISADGTPQNGTPQTTAQIFQTALAKFDTALSIATAAKSSDMVNLAKVGRGRALLGLNRPTEAAAAVADVPSSFVYNVTTSSNTPRQYNGIYYYFNINQRFSAIDREGGNGLPYLSANDPRVPYEDSGDTGFDGERELILQEKYTDRNSPIPLASGAEARLIQAEGALRGSTPATFVTFINQARAAQGVTTTVTDPGTANANARVDLLFRERAYALWLTAHRLGDMRRLITQYGRNPETVFPTGEYSGGGTYGTDVNLPIPQQELNNPNYTGACNKSQA